MSKYIILKTYEQVLTQIEDLIGDKETNNNQLFKLGKYLLGNKFLNVYSSDQFPKNVKNNQCFIINTDSINEPGTHWIAVYKYKNKFYFYDTFNRKIQTLSKYFKNIKNVVNANADRDQSFNESNCGARSLSWVILASRYKPDKTMNII